MGGCVHFAQFVHRDERVHLGGRHRGMTQQLLHDSHIGAAVEQVRREGVPEHVRRDLGQARLGGRGSKRTPRSLPGEPAATGVQEDGPPVLTNTVLTNTVLTNTVLINPVPASSRNERWPGLDQVGLQRAAGVAADRHDSLLVPLAGQPHGRHLVARAALTGEVEILDVQPESF
jgi:hypothetical protein